MDFQIILLPENNYWSWVKACRPYVMAYGANLTSDRLTAANYMAPRQVISFPSSQRLASEVGDLKAWFEEHHTGIRLDPIEADVPSELEQALKVRLEAKDRYGQRQRPFYLLWPTDYAVITQPFGANPEIYTRFGMPGHEGIDFRALPYTEVYCCADGEVYRVHTNPQTHAYGIHVRVRHAMGYRTVYGHLAQAHVSVGEVVRAGQVIGRADSTGASTASHLHMTLKQDGATARKETTYPKDVIDPTPYMVWPESGGKGLSQPDWAAGRCLIGFHGRVGGQLEEADFRLLAKAQVEAVKVDCREPSESIDRLRSLRPGLLLMARLGTDLSGDPVSPQEFVSRVAPDAERLYAKGLRYFEVLSAPNLHLEGWNRSWRNGGEFGRWYLKAIDRLQRLLPQAKFGFPGLTPGPSVSGWRQDPLSFLEAADEAAASADWIGAICVWTSEGGMRSFDGGRCYLHLRNRYPEKLIFITEFNNPAPNVDRQTKARQYREYFRMLRSEPAVGAAFLFPLSAREGYGAVAARNPDDSDEVVGRVLAERDF